MRRYTGLENLQQVLYEELMKVFNAGHKATKFGVWLVRDVDESNDVEGIAKYVEVSVEGADGGREVVEICDCRACICECFEEQVFGVEGRVAARGEEELKRVADAVAGIVRLNYGGGYERYVEELKQLGLDVLTFIPRPGEECSLEDW